MYLTRLSLIILSILACSFLKVTAQDPYFPPPSSVIYQTDTLTIYPPDSLPGDPIVLLGYNIYVDNIFFDNVLVDNQTDTVDYIFDYSGLYPGNHEFCVKTYYNQWISDPACDSGLVIYGYELPFLEDWSSGNFTENNWITESGNWTVEADEGNPGPAAVFSGQPAQYNYEIPLESYAFRGDLLHVGINWLSFDLKLESINSTGDEKLFIQRWNWTTNTWQNCESFSNLEGSFSWRNNLVACYNNAGTGQVFKIRFVATGLISYDIIHWLIDNVHIYTSCIGISSEVDMWWQPPFFIELDWDKPSGFGPQWYFWGREYNYQQIGSVNEGFCAASCWKTEQLETLDGLIISKIGFFLCDEAEELNVRIWEGIDSTVNLIVDQPIDTLLIGWNYVNLDSLVYIDASKDLYVGYYIQSSYYSAGADNGPAVDGFGNMVYYQGTWHTLLEVNPDLDYNWNIKFMAGPGDYTVNSRYKVYRNVNGQGYEFYNFTNGTLYEDYEVEQPCSYCYLVSVEWSSQGDTCESAPSDEVCNYPVWIRQERNENDLRIYPNPASDLLHIESGETIEKIRIYSLLGKPVSETIIDDNEFMMDVSGLKEGIFYMEILFAKMTLTEKLIILH